MPTDQPEIENLAAGDVPGSTHETDYGEVTLWWHGVSDAAPTMVEAEVPSRTTRYLFTPARGGGDDESLTFVPEGVYHAGAVEALRSIDGVSVDLPDLRR